MFRRAKQLKQCTPKLVYGLKSLAIAPQNRVDEVFTYFYNKYYRYYQAINKEENGRMINYFLDNFLFKYPLKEWNVSDFKDRTNNCCKSLNGDLKRYFGVGIKDYRNNIEKFEKNICLYIKQRKSLDETRKVRKNLEVEIKDITIQHLIENEKNIDVKALAHILLMFSKREITTQ